MAKAKTFKTDFDVTEFLALVGVPRALGVVGCFHQQQPSYMQGNASLK